MTWNSENECYYERHRLSNGQYCMVAFYRFYRSRSVEYHVVFAVADKKKALNGYFDQTKDNNISLKYTGRCGAEALIWCRDMCAISGIAKVLISSILRIQKLRSITAIIQIV